MRNLLHRSERGMTLTEAAIFLGIAGVVFAAIWAAAAQVSFNRNITGTLGEIMQVTQNIRGLYSRQSGFSGSSGFDTGSEITEAMIKAEVVPPEMIDPANNAELLSRWNTPVHINIGSDLTSFEIEFADTLPTDVCRDMTSRAIGPGRDHGLLEVKINGNSFSGTDLEDLTPTSLPENCTNVAFVFHLKG
jgi:hypothetical protein